MTRVTRDYSGLSFDAETIGLGVECFKRVANPAGPPTYWTASIVSDGAEWAFPEIDEFKSRYKPSVEQATISLHYGPDRFDLMLDPKGTVVAAQLPAVDDLEELVRHFDRAAPTAALSHAQPKVFIGHGRDDQWRKLADHLRDLHGIEISTYESTVRPSATPFETLRSMAHECDYAVLVYTRDDDRMFGTASPNLIHETGLFQALLGRHRTLIVREESCESYHNLDGLHAFGFPQGAIESVFGEVAAVLNRPAERP